MLDIGVVVLAVAEVDRAARFWTQALDDEVRRYGFGGWGTVLNPDDRSGVKLALQHSESSACRRPTTAPLPPG